MCRRVSSLVLFAVLGLATPGCKNDSHPPSYEAQYGHEGGGGTTAISIGTGGSNDSSSAPPEDTTNLCGNQILPILTERPNLYLILDRSGSMSEAMSDDGSSNRNKYESSVTAIHDVLFAIGHRVAYGAAVFPSIGNTEDCSPGKSVDPVKSGDSVTYARNELDGPHLKTLTHYLNSYRPEGSTPTSATLEALLPMLLKLEGKTTIILTTDGAPNCNEAATCDTSNCIANIEGAYQINGELCDDTINCCAPTADYGPYNCIDTEATMAPLAELLAHGIKTYVVGLPGTDAYRNAMNQLAKAGGTAREQTTQSDPLYYRVEDSAALVTALKSIVADISISCTVELDEAPPDWDMVNVYFDNGLVKYDEENGWKHTGTSTLQLVGSSCTALRSGDVFQVQVVAGCPTEVIQ
jgi:hypothetical protein